jgi:LuxR family maltose regulon positive regulatory protein
MERHAWHRTAHAALIADIRSLLAGPMTAPPAGAAATARGAERQRGPGAALPADQPAGPEIADELFVSPNTVRTHLRHLYAKLGTHSRAVTVARTRALGLLAPSPHRGQATRPG